MQRHFDETYMVSRAEMYDGYKTVLFLKFKYIVLTCQDSVHHLNAGYSMFPYILRLKSERDNIFLLYWSISSSNLLYINVNISIESHYGLKIIS